MAPEIFTIAELSIKAEVMTRKDHQRIRDVLRELRKTGEIERISRGQYYYSGRAKKTNELREIMWRVLRARRNVTVEDMMELCGASERYAREWLSMLVRRGVLSHKNDRYRMITDPIDMPSDEEKAEALRLLRQRRKSQALEALDRAAAAIAEAREKIETCGGCYETGDSQGE
jgi:predicted transcriptional regulator of viral defense system